MKRLWKLALRTIWPGSRRRSSATRPSKCTPKRKLNSENWNIPRTWHWSQSLVLWVTDFHCLCLGPTERSLKCGPRRRQRCQLCRCSCDGSSWGWSRWRKAWTRRWAKGDPTQGISFEAVVRVNKYFFPSSRKRRLKNSLSSATNWSAKSRVAEHLCKYCLF